MGFDIILKSRPKFGDSIPSGSHCLEFGLCRRSTSNASNNSKNIPLILRNPPEAHTPSNIPTACLASLDLQLRYGRCNAPQQLEIQALETLDGKLKYGTEHPSESCSMQYAHSTGKIAVAAFALSTTEDPLPPFDQPLNVDGICNFDPMRQTTKSEDLSLQFLDLFNFGLQKLILSGTTRNDHIKVVGKNKLQNLSLLAPAVFNPEYREVSASIKKERFDANLCVKAMKQRAVSLSTISRSLVPMLENSNPLLQSKLSAIFWKSTNGEEFGSSGNPHDTSLTNNFKPTIESSLWNLAQHHLKRAKNSKISAPFFEPNYLPRKPSLQADEDNLLPAPSQQEFHGFDSEILGMDSDPGIPPNSSHSRVSEKLLSDGSSMLSFQDLHELTQTTDMTQTTQTSIENCSQTSECQPCSWDDLDILLSDEILMDEGFEQYGDFEEMELF